MENLQRFEQPPTAVNVTVAKRRPREYLTEREIERLMKAAEDRRAGWQALTGDNDQPRQGPEAAFLKADARAHRPGFTPGEAAVRFRWISSRAVAISCSSCSARVTLGNSIARIVPWLVH